MIGRDFFSINMDTRAKKTLLMVMFFYVWVGCVDRAQAESISAPSGLAIANDLVRGGKAAEAESIYSRILQEFGDDQEYLSDLEEARKNQYFNNGNS